MADRALLSLGLFVFAMDTLPFAELQRRTDWRHDKAERHGLRAASQFLGPGQDTITINGTLAPELGGIAGTYSSLGRLREMAASGDAWPLVDGTGTQLGIFRIMAVDERQTVHTPDGLARKVEFAIDLERAD